MNIKRSAIALACLALGLVSPKLETTAQTLTNTRTERAKLEVSRLTGIPASQLTIVKEAALADTGITRFKMTDSQGKVYGVSLDAAGNPVLPETLAQTIRAIDNRGFVGKLQAELAELLNQGTNNPIRVVIWLNQETAPPLRPRTHEEYQAHLAKLRAHYAAVQQPLVNLLNKWSADSHPAFCTACGSRSHSLAHPEDC